VIGGFTLKPVTHRDIEPPCETCMYYEVNQRFCELPELNVPVELGAAIGLRASRA
jgi:hypothetical protein